MRRTLLLVVMLAAAAAASAGERRDHLPFFHENRAFVLGAWERARIDAQTVDDDARGWDFDPFEQWRARDAVDHARAALDSARTPAHLGAFHTSLDSLLQEMQRAADRLDDLEFRFAAHVRTGLELTLAAPAKLDIVRVEADWEGTAAWQHDLTGAERAALGEGGILEVLRRPVEPRRHEIEVRAWVRGQEEPSVTHVAFDPTPNRLVRVHLTLEGAGRPASQQRTLVTEGS